MFENKKIMVAMSGGVDSSVTAFLLKEQGFSPVGVTMSFGVRPTKDNSKSCCAPQNVTDAKSVCDKLGIEHLVFDCSTALKEFVIDNFVEEYKLGRTPNPCVRCNAFLKFGLLLSKAKELGFSTLATGHYAKITEDETGFHLETADDKNKDQTYFLWGIKKENLPNILFPVSNLEKPKLRKIAEEAELPTAQKHDSQDICFVNNGDYRTLLNSYGVQCKKGEMLHRDGRILGEHTGIENYTIGQRKGLGIALGEPAFVCDIDVENNIVIIGNRDDLQSNSCIIRQCNFLENLDENKNFTAKIRSNMTTAACCVEKIDTQSVKLLFDEPQFAISCGQSAVVYAQNRVILGGIIEGK